MRVVSRAEVDWLCREAHSRIRFVGGIQGSSINGCDDRYSLSNRWVEQAPTHHSPFNVKAMSTRFILPFRAWSSTRLAQVGVEGAHLDDALYLRMMGELFASDGTHASGCGCLIAIAGSTRCLALPKAQNTFSFPVCNIQAAGTLWRFPDFYA